MTHLFTNVLPLVFVVAIVITGSQASPRTRIMEEMMSLVREGDDKKE